VLLQGSLADNSQVEHLERKWSYSLKGGKGGCVLVWLKGILRSKDSLFPRGKKRYLASPISSTHCWFFTPITTTLESISPKAGITKDSQPGNGSDHITYHRITEWPGLKRTTMLISSNPLLCAGSPTSRPGCPEPHPAWP